MPPVRAKQAAVPIAAARPVMEARSVKAIPVGPQWQYEPKWDGFRCRLTRDSDAVVLQSKAGQDLTRYFPELVDAALSLKATGSTLDGEIVVPQGGAFSFDQLLQRIHPSASRVKKLAAETPGLFLAFDLLATRQSRALAAKRLSARRPALEAFAATQFELQPIFRLSPASSRIATARTWLAQSGGGSDGVIAKRLDLAYQGGSRDGMQKIKNYRTADCVIGGFRMPATRSLAARWSARYCCYDEAGLLNHVGFSSAIKQSERAALTDKLEVLMAAPGFTGDASGGLSRWSNERSAQWSPLKPKLVIEISYDHFSGGRFRHGTSILRWRPDKAPRQCTMHQKAISPLKLLG